MLEKDLLNKFELDKFSYQTNREISYNFLESFVDNETFFYTKSINTFSSLSKFQELIRKISDSELAFLLIHSGLIPEHYQPDSSEETFYSKLCEDLIREWAVRIGFSKSYLPTTKSSTEDVTILNERGELIVCDGKAFRLGRSQAAPNVKDMLKEGDISKWLHVHDNTYITVGGMVVFPSTHDWKSSTDFYQYTTNGNQPILALNYQHLSYMLLKGIKSNFLINTLREYFKIFPNQLMKSDKKTKNRDEYYQRIEKHFFGSDTDCWQAFKKFSDAVLNEKCYDTVTKLDKKIRTCQNQIAYEINQITDINILRKIAIESEIANKTETYVKQMNNILKFRTSSNRYYDDDY